MNPFTHHKRGGMSQQRRADHYERRAWFNMQSRCNNPLTPLFERYGGRGIRVLYSSYEQFLSDVGPRPSAQHSLDRIDNDGHYEPGNCRWATRAEQLSNTSRNRRLTHKGKTLTVSEWASILNVKTNTLLYRLKRGWPVERCLECNTDKKRGSKVRSSKLTEQTVAMILSDTRSDSELAAQFGVSRRAIHAIRNRESWKHVEPF